MEVWWLNSSGESYCIQYLVAGNFEYLTHWGWDKMADNIFKLTFLNENCFILIYLKFVPNGPINNMSAFV